VALGNVKDSLSFIVFGIISTIIVVILYIFIGEKIAPVLLGAILIFLGVGIIFEPRFYSYKFDYYFDFSGYNIPFGIFMMVVGVLFIWTTFKRKAKT
jgi:hypothetical protein